MIKAHYLASHELGGFKESFSFARKFCRSCLTDKELSQEHFLENHFEIRTPQMHASQCSRLDGPDRLNVSGINSESIPHFWNAT